MEADEGEGESKNKAGENEACRENERTGQRAGYT